MVTLADCRRRIQLEFFLGTKQTRRISLAKIDVLINVLTEFRDQLRNEANLKHTAIRVTKKKLWSCSARSWARELSGREAQTRPFGLWLRAFLRCLFCFVFFWRRSVEHFPYRILKCSGPQNVQAKYLQVRRSWNRRVLISKDRTLWAACEVSWSSAGPARDQKKCRDDRSRHFRIQLEVLLLISQT